jgi:Predicted site-specific integrase-resolvase
MKLSTYAKKLGISYRTAWNWFKADKIKGAFKTEWGAIIVPEEKVKKPEYVVIYTRVSSSENKRNLDTQAKRLIEYAIARGYKIKKVIKEVGSGVNGNRPKLQRY